MNATVHLGSPDWSPDLASPIARLDPLAYDMPDDEPLVATRRALCRVATVAAEAGARFQREGVGIDPMAWMLAPRRLFRGAAPIEACLHREDFQRGVLLHGLSLDLDMDPDAIDELLDGDGDGQDLNGDDGVEPTAFRPASASQDLRLFTATLAAFDGTVMVHAFHASLAADRREIALRLHSRIGAASACAVIVEGFDASDPMVEALVAPAVADTLLLVAQDPRSPLAAGLDLNVEQRFYG